MTKKYVYTFGGNCTEGEGSMKNLLGGKGANLAEMANLGLPVPPGFTVTTECCVDYFKNDNKLPAGHRRTGAECCGQRYSHSCRGLR